LRQELADAALATSDRVTLSDSLYMLGLERPVVVWLRGRTSGADDGKDDAQLEGRDRLHVFSRCTVQLIKVDVK
jgi:hypothetical protein